MNSFPFVSVVIPTRNRASLLRGCLKSLVVQDFPSDHYEMVVIDDGSRDETPSVVREFAKQPIGPRVRLVVQAPLGLNAARNAGIAATRGDPVCFVDDDVEAPPNWLHELIGAVLRHPSAGAFGGRVVHKYEAFGLRLCGRETDSFCPRLCEGPVETVLGCNMAYARRSFEIVGSFDESLSGWGDELDHHRRLRRHGVAIVYVPSALVWHRRLQPRWAVVGGHFRRGQEKARYVLTRAEREMRTGGFVQATRYLIHGLVHRCDWGMFVAGGTYGEAVEATRLLFQGRRTRE